MSASRLVPALLDTGHRVVAASSPPGTRALRLGRPGRLGALRRDRRRTGPAGARPTSTAICYLVHSLDSRAFEDRDRHGATVVRDAVADSGVRRIVYLSGLVPDVPADDLSPHIASRLEVEEVLAQARSAERSVLSLRAGVVLGAGSTSFEVIRQLAHAAARPAGAELARAQGPADRRQRRSPRDGRGVRRRPLARGARHRRTRRAALREAAGGRAPGPAGLLRVRVPTAPVPAPSGGTGHRGTLRRTLLDGRPP